MGKIKHVSKEERKKRAIIFILILVLFAIATITLAIILIPKKKPANSSEVYNSDSENLLVQNNIIENKYNPRNTLSNSTSNNIDSEDVVKYKEKVNLYIKPETLTVDGAVIVIDDKNSTPYRWTSTYRLQQKIDDNWENMELKNPENSFLPDMEYTNKTDIIEQSLIWSNKYGKLEVGEYRIVKEVEGIEFYAEFKVQ